VNSEDIRLTESQRLEIASRYMHHALPDKAVDEAADTATDKAVKKVIEWGDEICPHILTQIVDGAETTKRECSVCWQALKKLVEG